MTTTQKRITVWSITAVVLGLIIYFAILGARSSTSASTIPAVSSSDHVLGPLNAKVVLIEYSDFQCPACGAFEPLLRQVKQQYGDKFALVYREFPLRQTHQYAQVAAQAGEAAAQQGKFWEYHDVLFERQASWPLALNVEQTFADYAKELGLDVAKFTVDSKSQAVKDRINVDVASGTAAKIPGTPTFFLNGQRINPQSYNDFKNAIDPLLSA